MEIKAMFVAKEITIKRNMLPFKVSCTKNSATYKWSGGTVYIYQFGAIVFAGEYSKEIVRNLNLKHKLKFPIIEEYEIKNGKKLRIEDEFIEMKLTKESQRVLANILAKSVALDFHEKNFDKIEDKFGKLNRKLSKTGKIGINSRKLLCMVARNNITMEEIYSNICVLDKPEIVWDDSKLDELYTQLSEEYELEDRFKNLNKKMGFIQDNYLMFLESLRSNRDSRLEWIIIILIGIEIILFLYELFFL